MSRSAPVAAATAISRSRCGATFRRGGSWRRCCRSGVGGNRIQPGTKSPEVRDGLLRRRNAVQARARRNPADARRHPGGARDGGRRGGDARGQPRRRDARRRRRVAARWGEPHLARRPVVRSGGTAVDAPHAYRRAGGGGGRDHSGSRHRRGVARPDLRVAGRRSSGTGTATSPAPSRSRPTISRSTGSPWKRTPRSAAGRSGAR